MGTSKPRIWKERVCVTEEGKRKAHVLPLRYLFDMSGSYNIAWIIAAALSIVMTAFLLYSYRGSRICIKGQEETGNTAKIQYNNGKMR